MSKAGYMVQAFDEQRALKKALREAQTRRALVMRREEGLTIDTIAQRLSLDVGTVSRMVRGVKKPSEAPAPKKKTT